MNHIDDIPFLSEKTPCDLPAATSACDIGKPPVRLPLARAEKLAFQIQAVLIPFCAPDKCVIAGSIRRRLETCGDIDIVCEPRDWGGESHQALRARIKARTTLIADGVQNLIVSLSDGTQLDIFFTRPRHRELFDDRPGNFGSLLLCRTGSVAHNIKLVERAKQLNLRWQPYEGVYRSHELIASETEAVIFTALNLPFIPPEERR